MPAPVRLSIMTQPVLLHAKPASRARYSCNTPAAPPHTDAPLLGAGACHAGYRDRACSATCHPSKQRTQQLHCCWSCRGTSSRCWRLQFWHRHQACCPAFQPSKQRMLQPRHTCCTAPCLYCCSTWCQHLPRCELWPGLRCHLPSQQAAHTVAALPLPLLLLYLMLAPATLGTLTGPALVISGTPL